MQNGLSVDVEDWFQVGAFENVIARGEWDSIKTRVEDNVYRVIDLFAGSGFADLQSRCVDPRRLAGEWAHSASAPQRSMPFHHTRKLLVY